MKLNILFLLILTLVSCVEVQEETPLAKIQPTEDKMLWPSEDLPLKMAISKDFTVNEEFAITESVDKWEEAAGLDLINSFEFIDQPNYTNIKEYYEEDYINGIYRPTTKIEGLDHKIVAICQSFVSPYKTVNGVRYFRIEEADIILNDYHHDFFDDDEMIDEDDPTTHYTSSVVLHEFGHFFGLFHDDTGIMDIEAPVSTVITDIDQDTANKIYDNYHDSGLISSRGKSNKYDVKQKSKASRGRVHYQIILFSK
jgi:hypothetical protein